MTALNIPQLETERLILRGQTMADLEQLCDLLESDRAKYMGGPISREEAWRWLASEVAMWDLMGFGAWGIETKDGSFVGQVGILKPPHFPEAEIGWTLLKEAEGKGYAYEAALAVLGWAWENRFETLVSYIAHANARSIALAERLGAELDTTAASPDADDLVYRHKPREAQA